MITRSQVLVTAATLSLVLGGSATTNLFDFTRLAQGQETQEVTIRFQAKVGDRPFSCTENYPNLGAQNTTASATDFRFYISGVNLIDSSGVAVPLTLQQDNRWQHQNVALLDFEDKSAGCTNGTVETRDRIVGTVPKGNYKGVQFTLGVPFNLNHEDVTLANSPLNLSALWWNWRGGYKFVRIDLKTAGTTPTARPNHGDREPQNSGSSLGFPIHLGSTGCQSEGSNQRPISCASPNTVNLNFTDFDPQRQVIIADLKPLIAETNITINQPETPPGCMSSPNDPDCSGIMPNFGLPFGAKPNPEQKFFRLENANP
jgi:uncharacterized repeat protein (TIGR04052 family)